MDELMSFTDELSYYSELATKSMKEPVLLLSDNKLRRFFGENNKERSFRGIPVISCVYFQDDQFCFFDDYRSLKGRLKPLVKNK